MLLDLMEKLVDKGLQLAKHRREMSKQLFDDFIQPIYSDFEAVHNNYLKSFQEYRNLIISFSEPPDIDQVKSLTNKIRNDFLFSEGNRKKVIAFTNPEHYNDNLESFLNSIRRYLLETTGEGFDLHTYDQKVFTGFYNSIRYFLTGKTPHSGSTTKVMGRKNIINEAESTDLNIKKDPSLIKKGLLKIVDRYIIDIQNHYGNVAKEYAKIKTGLLTK